MIRFSPSSAGLHLATLWCLCPGLVLFPFVFWQSATAGAVFALLWVIVTLLVRMHLASIRGSLTLGELRMEQGLVFYFSHRVPTRHITGTLELQSPLGRLAKCGVLVVYFRGGFVLIPCLSSQQMHQLSTVMQGGQL